MAAKEAEGSLPVKTVRFAKESVAELKKVHTPSRQETIQGTIGVLVMVFFFGLFLGLADYIVGKIMQGILV